MNMMRNKPCIIGGANSKFGVTVKKDHETGLLTDLVPLSEMISRVVCEAIIDAGITAGDVDAIYLGSCSPGAFNQQELLAPLVLEANVSALLYKPTYQVTAACASSSSALYLAADAIESGRIKTALVVGFEKMNQLGTADVTDVLSRCSWWPEEGAKGVTFPGLFAQLGKNYKTKYGLSSQQFREMLARISANNYRNGIQNPLAHFGPGSLPDKNGLTCAQAILDLPDQGKGGNPMISDPLRLHDCSPISDGVSALVLVSHDHPLAGESQSVTLAGRALATDRIAISTRSRQYQLNGAYVAVKQALLEAGQQSADLNLVEVHDCFTNNQLLCLEAFGLSAAGRAGFDYLEGVYDYGQKHDVNLSGGLKSKGHPVGATGVSMHFFAYRQLRGDPVGAASARNPVLAGVLNIGGSGVVNCASILRKE